jgi:hypothetical protein
MNMGQGFLVSPVLIPALRVLGRILHLLDALEVSFVTSVEAGVCYLLASREGRKRGKPHIDADNRTRRRQRRGLRLAREAGVPRARARAGERHGFRCARDGSMPHDAAAGAVNGPATIDEARQGGLPDLILKVHKLLGFTPYSPKLSPPHPLTGLKAKQCQQYNLNT